MLEKRRKTSIICKGQITVFMLMLCMVIFSLLMAQYYSAAFYTCQSDAQRAARLSVDSFLAAYQKPLRDRYQILAVDGGFGRKTFQQEKLKDQLYTVFEKNMKSSITKVIFGDFWMDEPIFTMLLDGNWDFFLREIRLNREDALIEDGVDFLMNQWNRNNEDASSDLAKKRQQADEQKQDESLNIKPEEEIQEITDPRDLLNNIWSQGILAAACPSGFVISEKLCLMDDVSFPTTGISAETTVDFQNDREMQSLFGEWKEILNLENIAEGAGDMAAVMLYISDVFQHAVKKQNEEPSVFDYEEEYLIAGNDSDQKNLENVLWKILAVRCVMNLAYIVSSPEMDAQVTATAGILSLGLLIPQLTELVAFLLKIAWAFSEALVDCRALLNGKKIPFAKSSATWYLRWEQMLRLNTAMLDGGGSETGMDYGGYLNILLLLTDREILYRRMTHLIEKNIRLTEGYEEFQIKNCIYGVQALFQYDTEMFGIYNVQSALTY